MPHEREPRRPGGIPGGKPGGKPGGIPGVVRGAHGIGRDGIGRDGIGRGPSGGSVRLGQAELAGRLAEISSAAGASAGLSLAVALVRDAQQMGETTAWVTPGGATLFPPDAERAGVDLGALAVVRAGGPRDVPRLAERLVRSGAFGLVVLDLVDDGARARMAPALLNRLAALCREHEAAAVCLTAKPDEAPSLGALVSLRAVARRRRVDQPSAHYVIEAEVIRDRRRPGRWTHVIPCRSPEGVEALLRPPREGRPQ